MDLFILIIEIIGTAAFAISGAVLGLKKKMDIFGVTILGLTAATGGGVLRDLILGVTPPKTFSEPIYALIALGVSALFFFSTLRRHLMHKQLLYDRVLLLVDSLGLGVFTVLGVNAAYQSVVQPSIFLVLFVSVITAVGGGIMRDIMAGVTPYIFVKHIYALAALSGAVVCLLLRPLSMEISMLAGIACVFILRCLSAHYRWNLPRAQWTEQEDAAQKQPAEDSGLNSH